MQTRKLTITFVSVSAFLCIKFVKYTRFQYRKEKRKRFYVNKLKSKFCLYTLLVFGEKIGLIIGCEDTKYFGIHIINKNRRLSK